MAQPQTLKGIVLGQCFAKALGNCAGIFRSGFFIYPMDEWEAFEEKLRALPLTNKDARAFSRFFVAGATTCELDKQGRISSSS